MNFLKNNSLPIFLSAVSLIFALLDQYTNLFLRYDRDAITAGELWRLLSAHLVHDGYAHLFLNLFALLIIWIISKEFLNIFTWWLVTLFCSLGITIALYIFMESLHWYVGLSGLLHSLIVIGALYGIYKGRKEFIVLFTGIVFKVLYEQFYGSLSQGILGDGTQTIVNAHLYGVIFGIISVSAVIYLKKDQQRG